MEKTICERKKLFWDDSRYHDISFSFEGTDKILRANKMILSLVSPVFEVMFYGDFEKQDPVLIKDIDYKTFHQFLECIYTDNFNCKTFEELQKFLYAANKYEVVDIEKLCEKWLIKNMKDYEAGELLKFAEMFNLEDLKHWSKLLSTPPDTSVCSQWIPYVKGQSYPRGMVIAGFNQDGYPVGVGRCNAQRDLLPGTLDLKEGTVHVCWGGKEFFESQKFEILCDGNIEWVPAKGGEVKPKSVEGGIARVYPGRGLTEDQLYIGKVVYNEKLYIGKIHPRYNLLFIPVDGKEIECSKDYLHLIDHNNYQYSEDD